MLDELLRAQTYLRADLAERIRSLGLGGKQQVIIIRPREPQSNILLPLSRLATEQLRLSGRRGVVVERAPNLVTLLDSDRADHGLSLANAIWKAGASKTMPCLSAWAGSLKLRVNYRKATGRPGGSGHWRGLAAQGRRRRFF